MRVRSKVGHNLCFIARYVADETTKKLVGMPKRVVIPAGSTLTLEDHVWNAVKHGAKKALRGGYLEIVENTAEGKKAAEAAELAKAKALVAENTKEKKSDYSR